MKTLELKGAALDWAVAKCKGKETVITQGGWCQVLYRDHEHPDGRWAAYCPSTDWSQGGPIIERESIHIYPTEDMEMWTATPEFQQGVEWHSGSTPLIAAMRCYCASKLGNEIEIPKELF